MTSTSPRFVALVALLSIAACKSQESQGTPPAPSAASTASAAPSAPANDDASAAAQADGGGAEAQAPKRAIPRNAGHVTMILSAINSLDLRDPEKNQKLDAIAKSFTETDGTRDEGRKIHDELSAQVKAGKIETAKLEPLYAELEKAAKEGDQSSASVTLDGTVLTSFPDLVELLDGPVLEMMMRGAPVAQGTQDAFRRRLHSAAERMGHLVSGHSDARGRTIDWSAQQVTVVDIHSLHATAQLFGMPARCEGATTYGAGGALGDALLSAATTARGDL